MTGTLTFNLPEDEDQFRVAQQGRDWKLSMHELDEFLRVAIKHGHEFKTPGEVLVATREKLHSTLSDFNLTLLGS
jgi:hypothetical protein